MTQRTCKHEGCERKHAARGLCSSHYCTWYRKANGSKRGTVEVECPVCGTVTSKRADGKRTTKYCSLACRDVVRSQQYAERRTARRLPILVREGGSCSLPATHPVMRYAATQVDPPRWWVTFTSGPCAWCRENFTAGTTGTALYCSKACARNAAHSKRGRFRIPMQRRLAIYERDDWTCQLCLEPVDPDLMSTNPSDQWGPTLDHIECQSWSLIPDHSDENLRLAHRWCNSVRGDASWYSEADLRVA